MVGAGISTLTTYFQTYGVMDFILPFLLVFTIIFAVTAFVPLFKDHKNFRVVIALILGLIFVAPHVMGTYPLGYDPVQVMNEAIPSISLVAVAAVMLLLLMGIFGTDFSKKAAPVIAIASIGFIFYIFGASLNFWTGPYDAFSWWTEEATELLIIILAFGVVVWLITKEPSKGKGMDSIKNIGKWVGDFFEKK
ncbi:hypothetical protein HOL21_04715 [Candidatus Woesearchaeota archaeon]|jgi:hypothetical protein|nr:hypothetical protein [Candidatus Woesearchaeota archaeon]MBT5397489.1 hypothetical protein [Candidatus Woesearchaeota archaeon]MBT5924612.1 hypothetical protein [Candidatus Woesearchaeota archaeon]MBT6367938.1 hypothetical protein [Candidatus Woesearchaeota archaeon]MBT7763162.1 hypothetical protein [Candidatus Woesearchaeota archaeon]